MPPTDPDWDRRKARRGWEVVNRVRKKGSGRVLAAHNFYPEVLKLKTEGWTYKEMARYLGYHGGPRTAVRYGQIMNGGLAKYAPRQLEDLRIEKPEIGKLLHWDIDGFDGFFRRFSPYESLPPHMRRWVVAFLAHRRLMLNVPPGHGKSETFMVWIPIWLICRNRNVQILMVSNSHEDAVTWAMEVGGQLEHNQDLINTFGRFAPETVGDHRWTLGKGVFTVLGRTKTAKGAQFTLESRGITSRVLGRRADYILVDDPTKQEDAASEQTRKAQIAHLRQQVFTRAEPEGEFKGGRVMVIGQRVHMLDLYGELEAQEWEIGPRAGTKAWHVQKYPAVLDWKRRKVLWPERWPWHELEQAYADVGGQAPFDTMYQQAPSPEGGGLVTQQWLNGCRDLQRPALVGPRGSKDGGGFLPIVRVLSVDPSPTKFQGIVVGDLLCHKDNFFFYVTEVHRIEAGNRQMQNLVDEILRRAHPDYFVFEESGFLRWFQEDPWWQRIGDQVKVFLHHTGVNKHSTEYGVQSLAADFEFGRISLPYGDEVGQRMSDMLGGEALSYPDGATTDLLMALWFVKYKYRKMNVVRALPSRIGGAPGSSTGGWSFLRRKEKVRVG